jgi:hypothetical protein
MIIRIPPLSNAVQGILLLLAGLVLILHVTGIITTSLNTIIFIGGVIMMLYGFMKIEGPHRLKELFKKRK